MTSADYKTLYSTKYAFVLQLRNGFQAKSNIAEQDNEEEDTVNQQWKKVGNIFDKASKTCLGTRKTKKKKERMDYTRHVACYRGEAPAEQED